MTYVFFGPIFCISNLLFKMIDQNSYDSRLSQARALASQLGLFAEENEIPRDLWDALESAIYNFYDVKQS